MTTDIYADPKNAVFKHVIEDVSDIAIGPRTDIEETYFHKIVREDVNIRTKVKFYAENLLSTGGGARGNGQSEREIRAFHTFHRCNSPASSPGSCTACAQLAGSFPRSRPSYPQEPVERALPVVGPPSHTSPKDTDMSRPPTAIHVVRQHHAEPGALPTGERTPTDVPPTVPARAHDAPDAYCPTCGLDGEGIPRPGRDGILEASYLCPAGHIWLTSWPEVPSARPPADRAAS